MGLGELPVPAATPLGELPVPDTGGDPSAQQRDQEAFQATAGEFRKGLRSSVTSLGAVTHAFIGGTADAMGLTEFASQRFKEAEDYAAQADAVGPNVRDYRSVKDFEDALQFTMGLAGQAAGSTLPAVALGGVGGAAKGLRGAVAGAFTGSFVPETGESLMSTRGEAASPQKKLAAAVGKGAVNATLDTASLAVPGGAIAKGFKGAAPRALETLGKTVATEGVTEGAQEVVGQAAQTYVNPKRDKSEDLPQTINAALGGAVGGAVLGGAGALGSKAGQGLSKARLDYADRLAAPKDTAQDRPQTLDEAKRALGTRERPTGLDPGLDTLPGDPEAMGEALDAHDGKVDAELKAASGSEWAKKYEGWQQDLDKREAFHAELDKRHTDEVVRPEATGMLDRLKGFVDRMRPAAEGKKSERRTATDVYILDEVSRHLPEHLQQAYTPKQKLELADAVKQYALHTAGRSEEQPGPGAPETLVPHKIERTSFDKLRKEVDNKYEVREGPREKQRVVPTALMDIFGDRLHSLVSSVQEGLGKGGAKLDQPITKQEVQRAERRRGERLTRLEETVLAHLSPVHLTDPAERTFIVKEMTRDLTKAVHGGVEDWQAFNQRLHYAFGDNVEGVLQAFDNQREDITRGYEDMSQPQEPRTDESTAQKLARNEQFRVSQEDEGTDVPAATEPEPNPTGEQATPDEQRHPYRDARLGVPLDDTQLKHARDGLMAEPAFSEKQVQLRVEPEIRTDEHGNEYMTGKHILFAEDAEAKVGFDAAARERIREKMKKGGLENSVMSVVIKDPEREGRNKTLAVSIPNLVAEAIRSTRRRPERGKEPQYVHDMVMEGMSRLLSDPDVVRLAPSTERSKWNFPDDMFVANVNGHEYTWADVKGQGLSSGELRMQRATSDRVQAARQADSIAEVRQLYQATKDDLFHARANAQRVLEEEGKGTKYEQAQTRVSRFESALEDIEKDGLRRKDEGDFAAHDTNRERGIATTDEITQRQGEEKHPYETDTGMAIGQEKRGSGEPRAVAPGKNELRTQLPAGDTPEGVAQNELHNREAAERGLRKKGAQARPQPKTSSDLAAKPGPDLVGALRAKLAKDMADGKITAEEAKRQVAEAGSKDLPQHLDEMEAARRQENLPVDYEPSPAEVAADKARQDKLAQQAADAGPLPGVVPSVELERAFRTWLLKGRNTGKNILHFVTELQAYTGGDKAKLALKQEAGKILRQRQGLKFSLRNTAPDAGLRGDAALAQTTFNEYHASMAANPTKQEWTEYARLADEAFYAGLNYLESEIDRMPETSQQRAKNLLNESVDFVAYKNDEVTNAEGNVIPKARDMFERAAAVEKEAIIAATHAWNRMADLHVVSKQIIAMANKAEGFSLSEMRLGAEKITPEQEAEVRAEVRGVLGDQADVIFRRLESAAGVFRNLSGVETLFISLRALDPMGVARHETMHAMFARIAEADPKVANLLSNAARAPNVVAQLRKLLADEPAALRQLADHEERVAYMYEFWAADKLKVGQQTETLFDKVRDFLHKAANVLFGIGEDPKLQAKAEELLRAIHRGDLADRSAVASALARISPREEAGAEWAGKLGSFANKVFSTADGYIRDQKIPAFSDVADKMFSNEGTPGLVQARHVVRNQFMNRYAAATQGLDAAAQGRVLAALQGGGPMPSGAEHAAVRQIRGLLDDLFAYAQEKKVKVVEWNPSVKQYEEHDMQRVPDFFPRAYDKEYLEAHKAEFEEMLLRNGYPVEKVLDSLLAESKAAPGENDTSAGLTYYAPSTMSRKLNIPDADLAPFMKKDLGSIMYDYINYLTRRAEYASRFGNQGQEIEKVIGRAPTERDPGFEGTGTKQGATPEQLRDFSSYVQAMEGSLGNKISPKFRKLMGAVLTYQNFRLLPLALFSSLIDPAGIVLRGGTVSDGFGAFKRGLRDLVTTKDDESRQLARTIGAINEATESHMVAEMYGANYGASWQKWLNDKLFKLNGMESWNNSMRTAAAAAGQDFIVRHATDPGKHSERYLSELGLEKADVQTDPEGNLDLTPAVVDAINRWVDGAVLRPSAATRPIWQSDPHFMLVSHLKQFTYSFQKTINERVAHEALHGNYRPLLVLSSYVPLIIASDLLRYALTPGGMDDDRWSKWGLMDWVMHGLNRAGITGPGQYALDALTDARRGRLGIEGMFGPTFQQATDILHAAAGSGSMARQGVRALPVVPALGY